MSNDGYFLFRLNRFLGTFFSPNPFKAYIQDLVSNMPIKTCGILFTVKKYIQLINLNVLASDFNVLTKNALIQDHLVAQHAPYYFSVLYRILKLKRFNFHLLNHKTSLNMH